MDLRALVSLCICGAGAAAFGPPGNSTKKGGGLGGTNYTSGDLAHFQFTWYYDWGIKPRSTGRQGSTGGTGRGGSTSTGAETRHGTVAESAGHGRGRGGEAEFVPMVWGHEGLKHIDEIPAGATTLLGFNEPNIITQSNMAAAQACELWPQLEKTGLALGSPAVNHCHFEPAGHCVADPVQWLADFFGNCTTAKVDFIAAHYYGCNSTAIIDFVEELSVTFHRPVWLTEFACAYHDEDANLAFMKDILPKLEALPATVLARYAWYATRTEQVGDYNRNAQTELLRGDALTHLGHFYNSV